MSRRNNTQKPVAKPVNMFCKVCQDAGKPESVFRSHFVRASPDPTAAVVCPTLLAQQCTYCFNTGHTAGYCKLAKQNARERKHQEVIEKRAESEQRAKAATVTKKPVNKNAFAALDSDSDSEEESPQPVKQVRQVQVSEKTQQKTDKKELLTVDNFPALPSVKKEQPEQVKSSKTSGTVSIINTIQQCCPGLKVAREMPKIEVYHPPALTVVSTMASVSNIDERLAELKRKHGNASTINWDQLEESSDDEEYEDDEEEKYQPRAVVMPSGWDDEDW